MPIFAPLDKPPPPAFEVVALGGAVPVELVWPAAALVRVPALELELVLVVEDVDTCSTWVGVDAVTCMVVDVGV